MESNLKKNSSPSFRLTGKAQGFDSAKALVYFFPVEGFSQVVSTLERSIVPPINSIT